MLVSLWARVTRRLEEGVVRLCRIPPLQHAATFCALDWDAAGASDMATLAERVPPVDLSIVEIFAMDEFGLRKGDRYAGTVVEPSRSYHDNGYSFLKSMVGVLSLRR